MRRQVVDPVFTECEGPGKKMVMKASHPAFGQTKVTRVSGGRLRSMGRRYRVKAYSRIEPQPRGYIGTHRVHYQALQERRWWGWRTIDIEEVPSYVHIYLGAYGTRVAGSRSLRDWGASVGTESLHPAVDEAENLS